MTIWDKYPNYSGEELRVLVKLSAQALISFDASATPLPDDVLQLPSSKVAKELIPLLHTSETALTEHRVQDALEDDELGRKICLKILGELQKYPELAARIAQEYEANAKKMAIPELMLLSGALVILAIKIKKIKWGDKKKELEFYESSNTIKNFVAGLLKSFSS